MRKLTCDYCGAELERHGERYTVTFAKVPAVRSADSWVFDLCPECRFKLITKLWNKEGKKDARMADWLF